MKPVLLIDFGSTYTKITAADPDSEEILGTAAAYTTVQTDINDGLREGLAKLEARIGKTEFGEVYACSSAAGGLRMVSSGLAPELTSEAAKMASLGAGAKVVGIYSAEMREQDLEEIREIRPDIFLLVGGTDGGDTDCILHNAKLLAELPDLFPIIVAGNRSAAAACRRILAGHDVYVCPNVMPKFGTLNIEPTQERIREIFLKRIVHAKGLSEAEGLLSGILMPTPAAVLKAMKLLAKGTEREPGLGDLLAVDVGGATTDVYSMSYGLPATRQVAYSGLPEPYAKRTVEGDIGMRYSIYGILEASGIDRVAELSGLSPERTRELTELLAARTSTLPRDDRELKSLDFALASLAIETAVIRHAGRQEEVQTLMGTTMVQTGKDLTGVKQVIVTGGSLIHTERTGEIAAHAFYDPALPGSLRPKQAEVLVDRDYLIASMGLLAEYYPDAALRILKRRLEKQSKVRELFT